VLSHDTRFDRLLAVLEDLAAGDLDVRFQLSDRLDEIDAIGYGINQMAEELRDTINALSVANEELSQFAFIVSHDLKSPLRGIQNCAEMLRQEGEDNLLPEQLRYLDLLQSAARRGQLLVGELLEYSQLGIGAGDVKPIDMRALIDETIGDLDGANDVEWEIQRRWPTPVTSAMLLRQVLANLFTNAITYNRSTPPRIAVGSKNNGDESQFTFFVRDNGIGIAPQYHKKIFNLFQRLHHRSEFDGSGVGLATVRKAALALGGSVTLDSNLGEGSTFWVSIPRSYQGAHR